MEEGKVTNFVIFRHFLLHYPLRIFLSFPGMYNQRFPQPNGVFQLPSEYGLLHVAG